MTEIFNDYLNAEKIIDRLKKWSEDHPPALIKQRSQGSEMEENLTGDDIASWSLSRIEEALKSAKDCTDVFLVADQAARFGTNESDLRSTFTLTNRDIKWLLLFCQLTRLQLEQEKQRRAAPKDELD
ncbi:MAG: hypothetical protein WC028_02885 [Candidatus Obscuribacterales bacterium]